MIKYSVPCLMGVESLVADELRFNGFQNVVAQNGSVMFEGDESECARANITLRCGERVLIFLASFKAETFDQLFDGVKAINFEDFIGQNDSFPVKGFSIKSKLTSVPACQRIVKKAVVQRLMERCGVTSLEESGPRRQIQFALNGDMCEIYIDTSGTPLYKRGYKIEQSQASIRETLAAAMVKISRYRGREDFIDPMCGGGTIVIEAAMAALKVAPGARREFDFESWGSKWSDASRTLKQEAREQLYEVKGTKLPIVAMDIDRKCVALTRENFKRAGLLNSVEIIEGDCTKYDYPEKGTLICNPPYGQRLLDIERARVLLGGFGTALRDSESLKKYIISSDETFEQSFGHKAVKRRKLYNGMIKCNLFMYY